MLDVLLMLVAVILAPLVIMLCIFVAVLRRAMRRSHTRLQSPMGDAPMRHTPQEDDGEWEST